MNVNQALYFLKIGAATLTADVNLSDTSATVRNAVARAIRTGFLNSGAYSKAGYIMSLIADQVQLPWFSSRKGRWPQIQAHHVSLIPPTILTLLETRICEADRSAAALMGLQSRYDSRVTSKYWHNPKEGRFCIVALKPSVHLVPLLTPMVMEETYVRKASRAIELLVGKETLRFNVNY